MIDKETVNKLIETIGDDGYDIFGNRFWLYFKKAADRYDGRKVTPDEVASVYNEVVLEAEDSHLDERYP